MKLLLGRGFFLFAVDQPSIRFLEKLCFMIPHEFFIPNHITASEVLPKLVSNGNTICTFVILIAEIEVIVI